MIHIIIPQINATVTAKHAMKKKLYSIQIVNHVLIQYIYNILISPIVLQLVLMGIITIQIIIKYAIVLMRNVKLALWKA